VTDAALEIRADVLGTLPLGLHVVMAGGATPVCLCMIEVDGWYPGDRGVAAIACFRRQDVIRRLRRRADVGADAMTCRAIPRCAFENGIRVALLARQIAVPAGELKAGCEMVELGALLSGESGRRKRKCEQKCQEPGE